MSAAAPEKPDLVRVKLDRRGYDIIVGRGLLPSIGSELVKHVCGPEGPAGRTVAVLFNPKVDFYYGKIISDSLNQSGFQAMPISLVAGETFKTLQTVRRVYSKLLEQAVDRRTIILAVGGGVIGDVAGFVAATYQRGLDFVQVPTTLLAQVDSSVGGKVGVNLGEAKNLIGAFYQPKLVLVDPDTLSSLPFRERRSGLAEIIKYGAIADEPFFNKIADNAVDILRLSSSYLQTAIARSCRIKARIVEQDERDEGIRATLNFGHSVGHAAEALTGYHVYRHGEAVAIGMVSACLIGEEVGITDPVVTDRVIEVLRRAGFPVRLADRLYTNDIVRVLSLDKKAVAGNVRFVLLESLGRATAGHHVPEQAVGAALTRQRGLPE